MTSQLYTRAVATSIVYHNRMLVIDISSLKLAETYRYLLSDKVEVVLAVGHARLGCAQLRLKKLLSLFDGIRQHDIGLQSQLVSSHAAKIAISKLTPSQM